MILNVNLSDRVYDLSIYKFLNWYYGMNTVNIFANIFIFLTYDAFILELQTTLRASLYEIVSDLSIHGAYNELNGIDIFDNYASIFLSFRLFSENGFICLLQPAFNVVLLENKWFIYV